MGLFGTIKKAMGIAEMKTDEALDNSLNPIDKAKLNIKQKKDKLQNAQKSYDKANELFHIEKNKLLKLENTHQSLLNKKDKLIVAMNNFKVQGMSGDEIRSKVAGPFEAITENISQNEQQIETQKTISQKHEQTVSKFKEMINVYKKAILADENEVKLLESQYNMADTSAAIADAMNELNADGSSNDIAELRAKSEIKAAKADALMDTMKSNQSAEMSIDDLLAESSSSSSDSELDMLLGMTDTPKQLE
jgi:chromosome segregation ATPase